MNQTPEEQIKQVNETIPVHNMWDGFWIMDFENGLLTVSCSFDRLLYRNFDIIFTDVTFFNIPVEWSDTSVPTNSLFRESNPIEFLRSQPDFLPGNKIIIALDLIHQPMNKPKIKQTYFIVASSLKAEKCLIGNAAPKAYYKDPFSREIWPCLRNKVMPKD